jgi:hypothetical protein
MSDHESLNYLTTMDLAAGGKTGRLARWMEHLADYDFTVKHIRGAENGAADGLSRQPEQRAEYNAAATTTTQ